MADERLARGGELDALVPALEQLDPGLGLQARDLLRDGRLRVESASAAAENEPRSATSRRTFRRRRSSIRRVYHRNQ